MCSYEKKNHECDLSFVMVMVKRSWDTEHIHILPCRAVGLSSEQGRECNETALRQRKGWPVSVCDERLPHHAGGSRHG